MLSMKRYKKTKRSRSRVLVCTLYTVPPRGWADHLSDPSTPTPGHTPALLPHKEPAVSSSGSQQRKLLLVFPPLSCSTNPNKALPEFLIWSLIWNFHFCDEILQWISSPLQRNYWVLLTVNPWNLRMTGGVAVTHFLLTRSQVHLASQFLILVLPDILKGGDSPHYLFHVMKHETIFVLFFFLNVLIIIGAFKYF